jgi:3-deoxy-D-manno-octulosonate 8-phosphate phosphatase KdsC-like HAD superfamily phosphatase
MQPFEVFPTARLDAVRFVLTDVDDTLTEGARLPAAAYDALERLYDAGLRVVPVTAAPAGWCDLMCRMWPVAAVIGENGGLCFRDDPAKGSTERRFWASEGERRRDRRRLAALGARIQGLIPGSEPAPDQAYRETTLAFCNPGPPVSELIAAHLAAAGARTVVNSLWVLGWFAGFDKLAMTRRMLAELFALDIDRDRSTCIYVGDSLNDEPMFAFFPNSVGVATVRHYLDRMATPPQWVTNGAGGSGFVEVADALLRNR